MSIVVNAERLWERLVEMGEIGRNDEGGLDRTSYSPAHLRACERFADWATEAGAVVETDAVGNVMATFNADADHADARPIVVGSHLDTVPNGGRYDGALGVLAGLEAVHSVVEQGHASSRPLLVVAFADEEGAHGAGTVGSRAMCFGLDEDALAVRKDPSSPSLSESMRRAGFDPTNAAAARRDVSRWEAFVEMHPEQGAVLEKRGQALAVVTSIVHSARLRVRVEGYANHAGTTPMSDRNDALVKAAEVISAVHARAHEIGEAMVATVGRIVVEPNTVNVIPGRVDLSVDVRAPDGHHVDDTITWLTTRIAAIGGSCEVVIRKQGVAMDHEVCATLERSAAAITAAWTHLPSGAGHDARTVAQAGVPTGMLFVPSGGGVSHSPLESSSREHCVLATRVLAAFIAERCAAGTSRPG